MKGAGFDCGNWALAVTVMPVLKILAPIEEPSQGTGPVCCDVPAHHGRNRGLEGVQAAFAA